jgi:transcriptional regulator with XRE-family HTH domain
MKTFGEILKEKREAKGWSVKRLSEKLYVTTTTIYHWESNAYLPSILYACDIADVFGCSLDELCGRTQKGNSNGK